MAAILKKPQEGPTHFYVLIISTSRTPSFRRRYIEWHIISPPPFFFSTTVFLGMTLKCCYMSFGIPDRSWPIRTEFTETPDMDKRLHF